MTPEGWRWVRLREILRDRKDWITLEDDARYTRVSARVRNQGIELRDVAIGRDIKTKRQQLVRAGDLLVAEIDAKVGGIGVVGAPLDGSIVSSHYYVFEPDRTCVDSRWLHELAVSGALQRQVNAVGSTNYAAIRRSAVAEFVVLLPPLPEQREIAVILSSADAVIEHSQSLIDHLGVVKKAVMTELLSRGLPRRHSRFRQTVIGAVPEAWATTTVGDLADFSGGNGFRPPDWSTEGLPIIRIQNLNGSQEFNYYAQPPEPEWLVEPGQLLFAWAGSRGASFGPCIWPGPRGVLNQHIYRINPRPHVDREFLFWILRSLTEAVEKRAHGFKDSLVHLRKSELTGWPVALPALDEQREIAAVMRSVTERIAVEGEFLDGLKLAKRRLAEALLAGEVRVKLDEGPT